VYTPEDILKRIKEDKVERVILQFTDIAGCLKQIGISLNEFEKTIYEGTFFDGSSVLGYARIQESDMLLIPDLSTYALLPTGNSRKARFICDVYKPNGEPFYGSPRHVLKRMIETMKEELGEDAVFYVAPELEFYLLKDGKPYDNAGYFDVTPEDLAEEFRYKCIKLLNKMNIIDEAEHHEVGPGQHEIDIKYADAVKMADNTVTYKMIIKYIAKNMGLTASFMPKIFRDKPGSGMHCHVNIVIEKESNGKKERDNLFYDEKRRGLSDIALYSIAGLMKHAKASSAIWSPTINSYKRLGKSEAPKYIVWAHINRSAFIRVPAIRGDDHNSMRIEVRSPDPSCNPYLGFAVMLADMLDGIKNKEKPPEPVEEDMYHRTSYEGIEVLPSSLEEAIRYLEEDDVVKEALGDHCLKEFIELKQKELESFNNCVTEWERKKYMDV